MCIRDSIVAVDPTSPFTGGALLGDRVRMRDLSGDPGIFIRSMATRGSLGGLARATADVILALDAAGFDRVLVETVGVGQAEVEIASTAHTTIVVEAPGLGEDVQPIQAGEIETAWSDAGVMPGDPAWAGGTVFVDRREVLTPAASEAVWGGVSSPGGKRRHLARAPGVALRGGQYAATPRAGGGAVPGAGGGRAGGGRWGKGAAARRPVASRPA